MIPFWNYSGRKKPLRCPAPCWWWRCRRSRTRAPGSTPRCRCCRTAPGCTSWRWRAAAGPSPPHGGGRGDAPRGDAPHGGDPHDGDLHGGDPRGDGHLRLQSLVWAQPGSIPARPEVVLPPAKYVMVFIVTKRGVLQSSLQYYPCTHGVATC